MVAWVIPLGIEKQKWILRLDTAIKYGCKVRRTGGWGSLYGFKKGVEIRPDETMKGWYRWLLGKIPMKRNIKTNSCFKQAVYVIIFWLFTILAHLPVINGELPISYLRPEHITKSKTAEARQIVFVEVRWNILRIPGEPGKNMWGLQAVSAS